MDSDLSSLSRTMKWPLTCGCSGTRSAPGCWRSAGFPARTASRKQDAGARVHRDRDRDGRHLDDGHQGAGPAEPALGDAPSDFTVRRVLNLATDQVMVKVSQARARTRKHVWDLIEAAGGFPWLEIAGKTLAGWTVIDTDGTLITAHSDKDGAAPTWKMGYGFPPAGGVVHQYP